MGKNRNQPLGFIDSQEKYDEEDVCKFFLVTICPNGLFPNTRYDMGACNKRHDQFFSEQFYMDQTLKKYNFEKLYIENALKMF